MGVLLYNINNLYTPAWIAFAGRQALLELWYQCMNRCWRSREESSIYSVASFSAAASFQNKNPCSCETKQAIHDNLWCRWFDDYITKNCLFGVAIATRYMWQSRLLWRIKLGFFVVCVHAGVHAYVRASMRACATFMLFSQITARLWDNRSRP